MSTHFWQTRARISTRSVFFFVRRSNKFESSAEVKKVSPDGSPRTFSSNNCITTISPRRPTASWTWEVKALFNHQGHSLFSPRCEHTNQFLCAARHQRSLLDESFQHRIQSLFSLLLVFRPGANSSDFSSAIGSRR